MLVNSENGAGARNSSIENVSKKALWSSGWTKVDQTSCEWIQIDKHAGKAFRPLEDYLSLKRTEKV